VSRPTLFLSPAVRETLVSEAAEDAPAEVCGVLLGTGRESDTVRVTDSRQVANVASDARTQYELDPGAVAQVFAAVGGADGDADRDVSDDADGSTGSATEVVGFYHSHPRGPAGPSATDRAQAQWPGYVYLIVSLTSEDKEAAATGASTTTDAGDSEADVGAWRWTGEEFEPLAVQVDGGPPSGDRGA
jgi:proteasome lid subunit RPN8/RPN11